MSLPAWSTGPLLALGGASALLLGASAASAAWLFLRPSSLPAARHPSQQPYLTYALVTGSTDGIGRALALELAARGFALVLHGRNAAKLQALAVEVRSAGAPDPKLLLADADACDAVDFDALLAPLRRLRITLLVNNVGSMGHLSDNPFRPLTEYSREDVDRLVDLNERFMAQLTRALLPTMLRAADPQTEDFDYPVPVQREVHGAAPTAWILNASSAAKLGVPYVVPYAASKGFVEAFSAALKAEFEAEGLAPPLWGANKGPAIDAMAIRIGSVVTKSNPLPPSVFAPSAEKYAAAMLDRVGCGYECVEPYWGHWLQVAFFMGLVEALAGQWARRLGIVVSARLNREARQRGKDKAA